MQQKQVIMGKTILQAWISLVDSSSSAKDAANADRIIFAKLAVISSGCFELEGKYRILRRNDFEPFLYFSLQT
ncbi:MAG: hypothetical protein ACFFAY_11115 [Promethearchaeota archaeon]